MKKVFVFLSMLAMAAGFMACSDDQIVLNDSNQDDREMITITATLEGHAPTRTTLADAGSDTWNVVWEEGDKIKIGEFNNYFTVSDGIGTTKGIFTGYMSSAGLYDVFHGTCIEYNRFNDCRAFPNEQTYREDKPEKVPMYGQIQITRQNYNNFSIQLNNLCGIFRLNIGNTGGAKKVRSIKISANEPLSGKFDLVDVGDGVMKAVMKNYGDKFITLNCGVEGVALSNNAADTPFYIVVPENEYSGFTIEIFDTEGKVCKKTLKNNAKFVVRRSQITDATLNLSSTDFKPVPPEGVDFGCGVLWATFNIGASKPEEIGNYYAWGETEPKSTYSFVTYKWSDPYGTINKYRSDPEIDRIELEAADDVAQMEWGDGWRMPTYRELLDLSIRSNTGAIHDYELNGVKGMLFISAKTRQRFFVPYSGYKDTYTLENTDRFYLWSNHTTSMYGNNTNAHKATAYYDYRLSAWWGIDISDYDYDRCWGMPVRAVKTKPSTPVEHEYVDLGLPSGLKWATCNIGANRPVEHGVHYAWGEVETQLLVEEGGDVDMPYSNHKYKWYYNGNTGRLTKYCDNGSWWYPYDHEPDHKRELDSEDDVAHMVWGGDWRMPTVADCQELIDNCTWTVVYLPDGTIGLEGKSKNNDKIIFLPMAGEATKNGIEDANKCLRYWTKSLKFYGDHLLSNVAEIMQAGLSSSNTYHDPIHIGESGEQRHLGLSVRPVRP